MQIVKLFDEVAILGTLSEKTIELIHATSAMGAIKKLVSAYDIISLNLSIEKKFKEYEGSPPWDLAALKDLNHIRIELAVYYRFNFKPISLFDQYNTKLVSFFRLLQLKNAKLALET